MQYEYKEREGSSHLENLDFISVRSSEQKTVTFEIENPEHPENYYEYPEQADQWFDAAQWSVEVLGRDRNRLIGAFMICMQELEENDNAEPLSGFFDTLTQDVDVE